MRTRLIRPWAFSLLSRSDFLELGTTPRELGTVPRDFLTFAPGVTYHNIVTYTWDTNCEDAEADINYTIVVDDHSVRTVNFTFPDGSTSSVALDRTIITQTSRLFLSNPGVDGYSVYGGQATLHTSPFSITYDAQTSNQTNVGGMLLDNDVWISRHKLRPTLQWRIANCTWDGTFMRNCSSSDDSHDTMVNSGAGLVELDTFALDSLSQYMDAVVWKLYNDGDMLVTWMPYPEYAPTTQHIENVYGILATSIVTVASMSMWGNVEVQTTGEPQRQVYIVRLSVLFIVTGMLAVVCVLAAMDLTLDVLARRPAWNTSFLNITTAVRGQWWEISFGANREKEQLTVGDFGKDRIRFAADGSGRLIPQDEYMEASKRRSLNSFSALEQAITIHRV
jgi:hypothetical protein